MKKERGILRKIKQQSNAYCENYDRFKKNKISMNFWKTIKLRLKAMASIAKLAFLVFLGLLLIALIFYSRIIVERLPKEISFTFILIPFLGYFGLFLLNTFRCVGLAFFVNLLPKSVLNKPVTENSLSVRIGVFFARIGDFFLSPFREVFNFYTHFDWGKISLLHIGKIFYFGFYSRRQLPFVLFDFLPRLIVAIALFTDILVYAKFEYFYKTLALLLIPLCYNVLIRKLREFELTFLDAQQPNVIIVRLPTLPFNVLLKTERIVEVILNPGCFVNPGQEEAAYDYLATLQNFGTIGHTMEILLRQKTEDPTLAKLGKIPFLIFAVSWGYLVLNMLLNFYSF